LLITSDAVHDESNASDGGCSDQSEEDRPERRPNKKQLTVKRKKVQEKEDEAVAESEIAVQQRKTKPKGLNGKATAVGTHTIESVLATWDETTDYGKSFRSMLETDQAKEVQHLNKGAAKGLKGMIKTTLLASNFKMMVADKLRDHIVQCRVSPSLMFHNTPKTNSKITTNLSFLSVGEWVEVDADRTPGFNSERGIAVIISVQDSLADVK
jgi:hypothetical protein